MSECERAKAALDEIAALWPLRGKHDEIVVIRDGRRVGVIEIRARGDLELQSIEIDDDLRGRGHGGWTLQEICRLADEKGCGVYLDARYNTTESDGGSLPRFYGKFGFAIVEIMEVDDGVHMALMQRDPKPESMLSCDM